MDIKNLSTLKIHVLTQGQYDREAAAGTAEVDALYLTPEEASVKLSDVANVTEVKAYLGI